MQATSESLRNMGVFYLPIEAFIEALNFGTSNLGMESDPFLDEEKESIFDIIKNKEGQGSIYALEELCRYVEKVILGEDQDIEFEDEHGQDDEFDLGDFGFDSDEEHDLEKNGLVK